MNAMDGNVQKQFHCLNASQLEENIFALIVESWCDMGESGSKSKAK